jgi:putative hydrolase of HD superfamily
MDCRKLIEFLGIIEKLKCNTRHSWTSSGRRESVAEHTFRLAVMAMLCRDEYPTLDVDKVIRMCLIHDFGEAITGDVPAFYKTEQHERDEEDAVSRLVATLPDAERSELSALFAELKEMKSDEARLCVSLDKLETLISHNEADLSTWLPREYEENLVYGKELCAWSDWTARMHEAVTADSIAKIARESK